MACRSNQTGQFTPCAARRSLPRNCRTRAGVWKPCASRRGLHGVEDPFPGGFRSGQRVRDIRGNRGVGTIISWQGRGGGVNEYYVRWNGGQATTAYRQDLAPAGGGLDGVGGRNVQGTVVVFRQWKDDGDIIAVFPNESADHRGNVMSYQHVGQHGAASIHAMLNLTRPAPEGAAKEALRRELVGQGYTDLVERRKMA